MANRAVYVHDVPDALRRNGSGAGINDGDLDVVVDGLGVSLNLGETSFSAPFYPGCDDFFSFYEFGDFDNDGILDLLSSLGAQSYPAFAYGTGGGQFGTCITVPTGRDVHGFDVADLDANGDLDWFYPGIVILNGLVSQSVKAGDVNGDGQVNLLDVDPFIELLSTGNYLAEADINEDGTVNLLEVAGFVELLAGN